jgi:hypothetical protein
VVLEFTAVVLVPKLEEVRMALSESDKEQPCITRIPLLRAWTRVFDYSEPLALDSLLVRAIRSRCVEARDWCAGRCNYEKVGGECWTCFLNVICQWEEAHPRGDTMVLIDDVIKALK